MQPLPEGIPSADSWPDPGKDGTTILAPGQVAGVLILLVYVAEQYELCHAVSNDQPSK